ncbi:glycosyltransferase [Reichenbachiella agariperforans]|uniref:glycosyltransferase n=1 Tax=Reichenbachiella agariperforans TaxID=156994 RepID=UPI001C089304|nr:glycosyltransferase [Reichenbachiella agariperforans]MBU2915202.1 glycosyltransferase [Reichenbachiella agariperforans]
MKKKKALFVLNNLTTGGIQSQALLIARYLINDLEFEVEFWGVKTKQSNYTDLLEREGISYTINSSIPFIFSTEYFELNKFQKIKYWLQQARVLNKKSYSIIFPFACPKQMNILKLLSPSVKASFFFERGGHDNPKKETPDLYDRLVKLSKPVYLANSYHGAKAFAIIKGLPESKVEVVRNAHFSNGYEGEVEDWEALIPKQKEGLFFTMIANFFEYKDHATLIKAFGELIKNYPNMHLLLAGLGGPKVCHDRSNHFIELVKKNNLSNNIHFLGSVKNTKKLLKLTDVGVLSSASSEGCPNAVLEYMQARLPIVGSSIDAIKEVLPKMQHPYLFEPKNIKQCTIALTKMIQDHEKEHLSIGTTNFDFLQANFSLQMFTDKYFSILTKYSTL